RRSSDLASVAIENAQSFDHLALKARHDAALQDFCQRLLEATDEAWILRDAASVTKSLLDADCVGIFRHDAKADWLRLDAGLGWQPGTVGVATVPPAESLAGEAFLHRRSVEGTDLARERFAIPPPLAAHGIRSGLSARRKPPERRTVDVADVIRAALALQAPEFDLNHIRIVTALDPTPRIWADPDQLQQVLLNLFSNAVHAMRSAHGQGVLTVRSGSDGATISVQVEDDGPGIPAEHLSRIFDPFFTTKPAGEGTGLGLSLSIGIV